MRRALLLAFSLIAATSRAQTFQNPQLLPTPHAAGNILHGDLNGDGFDDIIYDDFAVTPATLHVMLSNGHGGFTAGSTISLPANTSDSCLLNRFTGSSKLDLACIVQTPSLSSGNSSSSVVFFTGNGDGTFAPARTLSNPFPQYGGLVLINAGDLNGDGAADLVLQQYLSNFGYPVLSDGHGGWTIGKPQAFPGTPIYAADLNGDGKIDWVFPGPSVALGNGDGTFGPMRDFRPSGFFTSSCAFGDLDGDGHVDSVCAYADTTSGDINGRWSFRFFHGNPDGSFTYLPADTILFGDGSQGYEDYGSFATPRFIADLNGDGIPDILGSSVDGLTAYYGKGAYQFGPPVHFAAGNLVTGSAVGVSNWQLMDTDGDPLLDVVSGSMNGLLLTHGKPGSTFATASAYEVNGIVGYVAVADFNRDGIADIVSTGDLHMAISLGRGDGTFRPYTNLDTGPVHWEGLYSHPDDNLLIHGDFNGDGKQDLIAVGSSVPGSFSEDSYYLQGNGDGTFQPPLSIGSGGFYSYLYGLSIVADLNGDHRDDLLGKPDSYTGLIGATISQGNGLFTSQSSSVPQESTGYNNGFNYAEPFPGVADFDGDGHPDIVVGARNNVYFLHGNGDGTFRNPVAIPIPPRPNAALSEGSVSVVAGDFDGDGHKDFAVLWGAVTYGVYISQPTSFGEIVVYYGNGDGTFSAPVVAAYTNADYVRLAAADLNHSGRDEIVAHGAGSLDGGTEVGIFRGAANRTFTFLAPLVAGFGLANVQIADLNGDGLPDLVFSNEDYNGPANSATVLLNLGSKPAVTGGVFAAPEPSYVGSSFTLTASFTTPDASLLGGLAIFSVDGTVIGSSTLVNNSASLTVPGTIAAGAHILSASWAGNTTFDPVTLSGSHNVVAVPTTTVLSSSVNPSILNQSVTFTALVTSANGKTPDGTVVFFAGSTPIGAQAVINPSAPGTLSVSIATSSLPLGNTSITASYVPAAGSTFAVSSATITQLVLSGYPTSMTLASSLNPSIVSQAVTFTAHVSAQNSANGLPAGSVNFTDGAAPLGTQPLDALGNAVLTTPALNVGTHPVVATFLPSNSFGSSFATLVQTVNAAATMSLLTVTPSTSTYGTPLTLTAFVTSPVVTAPNLTGTVTFCSIPVPAGSNGCTATTLGTATLNASGIAVIQLPLLPGGTYTLGCIYNGDAVHSSSACSGVSATIDAAPTMLAITSSANPSAALTPILFTATLTSLGTPVALQSLTFTVNGKLLRTATTVVNGAASVSVALPAGSQTIAVTTAGNANYGGSSAQLTETLNANPTSITLLASPTPAYQNQVLTLAATVRAQTGTATPDGSVTFYDGALSLGTVVLPPFAYTGTVSLASFTTSTLAPGSHLLTAVYTPVTAPPGNFVGSTSPALTIAVLPQTYSLVLADPVLTIQTEHHKFTTVTVTSIGGFNGAISVACGAVPEYTTCTWGQTTLALPANGTVSTRLEIDTDAVREFKSSGRPPAMPWRRSGELALALLAPLLLVRRRRLASLLPLALIAVLGLAVTGCGDKYPGHTAPGTYQVAINAVGTTAGAAAPTAHSVQLTVVVTE